MKPSSETASKSPIAELSVGGKMKRLYLFLLLLFPLILSALSVSASVNLSELTLSDRLEYTIQISSDSSLKLTEPSVPRIPNFSFITMRSSQSSSSVLSGMKLTTQHSRSFTYHYYPNKEGETTIPAQSITIGNKVYNTEPITVKVVKSSSSASRQSSPAPSPSLDFDDPLLPWRSGTKPSGETRIIAIAESKSIYKGEPLIIAYYLYTDQMVRSFTLEEEEDFPGYGKAIYEQPKTLEYNSASYQGKRYQRALIKKLVIMANETGELMAPILYGNARIYEFGYLSERIRSNPLSIEVKPLPKDNVPENFTGAVGNFEIKGELEEREVSLDGALSFGLRISGRGNFNQFTHPEFPPSLAHISAPLAMDKLNAGIEGSRTLYYTIVPKEKGIYTLPSLSFCWFDPSTGKYKTYNSKEIEIKVKSSNVISNFSRLIEADKSPGIKPLLPRSAYPPYRLWFVSLWYWVAFGLFILLFAFALYYSLKRQKELADPSLQAGKMANKVLKRYLAESLGLAKNEDIDFYTKAEAGLINYLSDRYKIPKGLSSLEKIEALSDKGIPTSLLVATENFLVICIEKRFNPDSRHSSRLAEDYLELRRIVLAYTSLKEEK